jgi:LmbE family N-acetylglucosaminyl deacetylase
MSRSNTLRLTRFAFVLVLASCACAAPRVSKVLLVVAHPDDDYNFAATTYCLSRELGSTIDEVVITNGEGGYRYSLLAERVYGVQLTSEDVGRSHLPAIRKQETIRAGRILGIRHNYFLNQKDERFTLNPKDAMDGIWDLRFISAFLDHLLARERYDFVLIVLPTEDTHGHHQAAAVLALESVARLPELDRPAVFGAVAASHDDALPRFSGLSDYPITRTVADTPAFVFDRRQSFGYQNALNYNIVVNWVIAEHKSQGLFQTDTGKHDQERFWLFALGGSRGTSVAAKLIEDLSSRVPMSAGR